MGKSKSWFDLNHDWITGDDLIWVEKIWFGNMWFDFILCDLICWFEQITTFSNFSVMITLLVFYCSWVKPLILVIIPSLIFAETLTVRPDVHWWHFAHRLYSLELLSFGWHHDLIWFVIWCIATKRLITSGLSIAIKVDDLEWPWTSIRRASPTKNSFINDVQPKCVSTLFG